MCRACMATIATVAQVVAGATSTGGLAALIVKRIRAKADAKTIDPGSQTSA